MAERSKEDEIIREALAEEVHNVWAQWANHMLWVSRQIRAEREALEIPSEYVSRWRKQIRTSYSDLSEDEKNNDRRIADHYLEVMETALRIDKRKTKIAKHLASKEVFHAMQKAQVMIQETVERHGELGKTALKGILETEQGQLLSQISLKSYTDPEQGSMSQPSPISRDPENSVPAEAGAVTRKISVVWSDEDLSEEDDPLETIQQEEDKSAKAMPQARADHEDGNG